MDEYSSVEKPNKYLVWFILLVSVTGIIYSFSRLSGGDVVPGKVLEIKSERDITLEIGNKSKNVTEQTLLVEIISGGEKRSVDIINAYQSVKEGQKIFIKAGAEEKTVLTEAKTVVINQIKDGESYKNVLRQYLRVWKDSMFRAFRAWKARRPWV